MVKYICLDFETEYHGEGDLLSAAYSTEREVYMASIGISIQRESRVATTERILVETYTNIKEIRQTLTKFNTKEFCWVFHNAPFEIGVMQTHFGITPLQWHDTMLMEYLMNGTVSPSLNSLSEKYGFGKKLEQPNFVKPHPIGEGAEEYTNSLDNWYKKLEKYNQQDVKLTLQIFYKLRAEMIKDSRVYREYLEIELPYQLCLVDMQKGCTIDKDSLEHLDKLYSRYINWLIPKLHNEFYYFKPTNTPSKIEYLTNAHRKKYKAEVRYVPKGTCLATKYTGLNETHYIYKRLDVIEYPTCQLKIWNPNAGEQNALVLIEQGVNPDELRKTKLGKYTVKNEELEKFAKNGRALPRIMATASKAKHLKSNFIDGLTIKGVRNKDTTILYPSFNQCVTATHRLSSSNPNLQNIPVRGKLAGKFRKLFIASPGCTLITGDLDRIELVVLGYYLRKFGLSSYLAEATIKGTDQHQVNADNWGISRTKAKKVIFTLIYGSGVDKLARELGTDIVTAKKVRDQIYETTKIDKFREMITKEAVYNGGFIYDIFGNKLHIPQVMSKNRSIHAAGVRQCGNFPIQGSAGSIFKYLQNKAKRALNGTSIGNNNIPIYRQILAVHDEAVYEFYTQSKLRLENYIYTLNEAYCDNTILDGIPITASFKAGQTWYESKGE